MKIYIVLWDDTHSDTTATPFANLEEAKAWAITQANSVARDKRRIKTTSVEGWLFHIEYSESCYLWITEHDL